MNAVLSVVGKDTVGIIAKVCVYLAENQVNILTINSIVPTNGCAVVTISAETMHMTMPLEELIQQLRKNEGVIKAEILAG